MALGIQIVIRQEVSHTVLKILNMQDAANCELVFEIYKVHTPTNALFIKLDKVLKFTLRVTLTCSYMFRSTTIIREPSLGPS